MAPYITYLSPQLIHFRDFLPKCKTNSLEMVISQKGAKKAGEYTLAEEEIFFFTIEYSLINNEYDEE